MHPTAPLVPPASSLPVPSPAVAVAGHRPALQPYRVDNRPPPWPLREVPDAALWQLQCTLQRARIDQALVWALIEGGFGGSDLAACLAESLLARLQATEPVPAQWTLLVLQALRDSRAVWEPAFVTERAALRRQLHTHPGLLLRRLCHQLERPWQVPLQRHRAERHAAQGPDRTATAPPPPRREQALQALRQQWQAWTDAPLPDALLARCVHRANRLNRHERGIWEPLVAVDPLREHLHGRAVLGTVLARTHLGPSPPSSSRHPLAAQVLALAAQARHDPQPDAPSTVAGARHRGGSAAVCSALLLQSVLPAIASRVTAGPLASTALSLRPAPEAAASGGVQAAPSAGLGVDFRYSGGVRPEEALHTVARSFTDTVSARWLGVAGRGALDFTEGLRQCVREANLTDAASAAPEDVVGTFLQQEQGALEPLFSRVQVPLFTRLMLDRSSHLTRVFLFVRAVSRLFVRITPRSADDPAMREAARWMQAFHDTFEDFGYSDAVRAAVTAGDAAQWLAPTRSTPAVSTSTVTPLPVTDALDGMNATALGHAVRIALPGNGTALQAVLAHVLGRTGFPDAADLEATLQRLYAGNRTQALVARVAAVPCAQVDEALRVLFFHRLAAVPGPGPGTAAARWQAQLAGRAAEHVLRGEWIAALSSVQAAALFHRDAAGSVHALLDEVLGAPAGSSPEQRWQLRLHGAERLTTWLEGTAGAQRMAGLLRGLNASDPHAPAFLFEADGLPAGIALDLLQRAVRHHLPDAGADTVQTRVAQARQSPNPVLSLAVDLQARFPLLQASACLSHAAVLLAPCPATAPDAPSPLVFPLPALPPNATLPALQVEGFLRDCGLPLFEQIDPDLPAWQAWALMACTAAFQSAAQPLLRAAGWHGGDNATRTSPERVQQIVAGWLLHQGLGSGLLSELTAGLDDAQARDQPMQATRERLQARLPALTHRTGRGLLWWLLVQHAGRPEWAVDGIPEWLDYGRSLQSLTFLHGVAMVEAAAAGASTQMAYGTLVGVPARLAAGADRGAADQHRTLVQALVRPALLHAGAHDALGNGTAQDTQITAALAFVQGRQEALALAASQLAARVPQRRLLAAQQLRAAGVPHAYWNQTIDQIPAAVLAAAGVARSTQLTPAFDIEVMGIRLLVRTVEEAIAQDSLLLLLVGGVYGITGQPSIARSFEQAFAVYRQQMTGALEGLLDRALDMLPAADRSLLRTATVTPLQPPEGPRGVVLRCMPAHTSPDPAAAVYLAVIPSAGFAVRLQHGDRFDGHTWSHGLLYDPHAFASGEVADRTVPDNLRFLIPDACTAGTSLPPGADTASTRSALLHEVAALMFGDFFNRTRDAELSRHTGMETLAQAEADVAEGLARFAVPFYGCARDAMDGNVRDAALDCTLDAAGLLLPGTGAARFLRSTTTLMVRAGEISAAALLRGAGAALLQLGKDIAAQSGLMLLRDLGRGALRLGRASRAWVLEQVLEHVPALERQLARPEIDEIAPGFALDGPLGGGDAARVPSPAGACTRVRRHLNLPALCTTETITLFDYAPAPVFDTPGDVGWFAGMQVTSEEAFTETGRAVIVDGEHWQQTRTGSGFRFARDTTLPPPVPRGLIRASVGGGESQLLRVTLHNPYPDHLSQVTLGAVVGRTAAGDRALITRLAPGRFFVAPLEAGTGAQAGRAVAFRPLESLGFTAAQNDAVKTAWWGAFHYSQQCRLSGAALVDRFGSQLQRQLEQLADLAQGLEDVRAGSPYRFENLPAQAVMSCAQSNCRYVQALRQQIGPSLWRAPRADDHWLDALLRDLLSPPGTGGTGEAFTTLDDTLEARFLTPRRGPAKTLAMVELTLRDDPLPRVFHASSGQRRGRSLLPIANLDAGTAPPGWQINGREVTAPAARYIDAQPTQVSIASGQVTSTVPNHSLHAEDLDGPLFNERNARTYDAERNLYYRIERYIADNRLDPSQVTRARLFSSRRICASCHISVGSLRARLPGARFEVIERIPGTALDNAPGMAT